MVYEGQSECVHLPENKLCIIVLKIDRKMDLYQDFPCKLTLEVAKVYSEMKSLGTVY